jgi:hypothetical protein
MWTSRAFGLVFVAFGVAMGCGGSTTGGPDDGGTQSGSTGAGGAAGAGGSGSGGSGGQPAACTTGTTNFHLSAASGDNADWCVGLQCTVTFMTITSTSGEEMPISSPCETKCGDCMPVGCPALCVAPQPMKPDGERMTWDGTFWQASTCGAGTACRRSACAAPGRYKVKMCAARRTSDAGPFCMPSATPTCVDLDFDYPSAAIVEGTLN